MMTTREMTKALVRGALIFLFTFTPVGTVLAQTCVEPPPGLVSWWPGDGNADDIVGGNNGALVGGTSFAAGMVGQAFDFDGDGDSVDIPNPENYDFPTWTYAFWFKSSQPPFPNLIGRQFDEGFLGWTVHFGVDGEFTIRIDTDRGVGQLVTNSTIVNDGEWHFGAVVLDETVPGGGEKLAKLSIDGAPLDSNVNWVGNFPASGGFLTLGAPAVGAMFYEGLLDEVQIFDRALSDAEILAEFNAGSAGKCFRGALIVIDEDSIDNGLPPNFFAGPDINDDIADVGLRDPLPAFSGANVGSTLNLYTGEVGDEGWFALKTIPASWDAAGPTDDGLRNFVGSPVGPGLGTPDANEDREALLDKIPDVIPLRATGLKMLEGQKVCAVVYDGDVSINISYDPVTGGVADGSLKGANLGTVAFEVISVTELTGFSSSSLPQVEIQILDAEEVCEGALELLTNAPEPISSSEPFDVVP